MRIATACVRTGFAMTGVLQGVSARLGGGVGAPRPTEGLQEVQWGGPMWGASPTGVFKGCGENGGFIGGLPGEGQREGNFWLNLEEGREVF